MSREELYKAFFKEGYTVDKTGNVYSKTGILRKCRIGSRNYLEFSIRLQGVIKTLSVHQLQAYLKYGDKVFEKGILTRHLNGDKLDNSWDNIAIGTQSDNMYDRPEQERINHAIKASSKRRRFTDKQVQKIKKDRDAGMTYDELSKKYNTKPSTLSYLFNKAKYT